MNKNRRETAYTTHHDVWCVMWCGVMWCDVMWCDVMCDVMRCDMIYLTAIV
jgi:hypothetical protein